MRRTDQFATALTIVFVISMLVPDNWVEVMHIGQAPLALLVFGVLCLPLLGLLLLRRNILSYSLSGGFIALAITAFYGLFRGNPGVYSIKYYAADLFCFGGLLAGHTLAQARAPKDTAKLVSLIAIAASVIIMLTYIGLAAGFVTTSFNITGRTVTLSIFNAVGLLVILLPWATASSNFRHASDSWKVWLLFGTTLGTALVSATRSTLIEVVVAACLYLILRRRNIGFGFAFRLVCSALVTVLLFTEGLPQVVTFAFTRLNTTQIAEESRLGEVSLLWEQMRDDVWTGQGLGSRFVSNVVVEGNPLASAPHIGVVTFLMKGGVAMFLAYALLPLCFALFVLFSPQSPQDQRAAASAVLMFLVLSSLSGGWSPLDLFAYGLALPVMTHRWHRLKPIEHHSAFFRAQSLPQV